MDTPAATADTILVATDITTDATLVKDMLNPEFNHIFTSTDPDKLPGDFVRHRPDVLVLAFNTLEKSERYYLCLFRLCKLVYQYPHRTVILCSKDELKRAYELCRKDYFDNYVLFWPMCQDSSRLPMSIHSALRELSTLKSDVPSAAEFAAQARSLAELGKALDKQVAQSGQHIESPQHLKQWAQEVKQKCEPLMKSVDVLKAMAERIQPIVLVVDDDELQRIIIGNHLKAENYQHIFASDGFEALNLLRKTQPDIILMDVMMPGMDGMETIRRLKAVPQSANIPVIMITGKSEGLVVVDCMKAGAVDFVVKPLNRAILIDKITRVLNTAVSPLPH